MIPLTFTIGIIIISLVILLALSRTPAWLKVVLLLGAVLRVLVGLYRLRNQGLDFDALAYHEEASILRESLLSGAEYEIAPVFQGKSGWTTLLGYLYYVGGAEPLLGLVLNSAVMATTSLVIYATARKLGASANGSGFAALCFLAPQFIVWGTLLLREPIIWLSIAAIVYFGVVIVEERRLSAGSAAGIILAFGLLYSFRSSIAIVLLAAILVYALSASRMSKRLRVAAVLAVMLSIPFTSSYMEESRMLDTDRLVMARSELSSANSGFGPTNDLSAASIYLDTPVNFARALVGPFPWEIAALGPLALFEWLCWIAFACPAFYMVWKRIGKGTFPLVVAVAILLGISVSSGNYGGISRLRLMPLVAVLPILALWWDSIRGSQLEKARPA